MKGSFCGVESDGWLNALLSYVSCGAVLAVVGGVAAGWNGFISSLLASGSYIFPSALLMAVVAAVTPRQPHIGAVLLQIGIFVRTLTAIGLMCLAAWSYQNLCWPVFLISLFIVASAPMAGQLLLKK